METITEDKWDEDIWGIEHKDAESRKDIPKLFFYFAEDVRMQEALVWVTTDWKQDHWVADHTRDGLIAARGKEEGDISSSKPVMAIDRNGVGHDFCISKSFNRSILGVLTVQDAARLWRRR